MYVLLSNSDMSPEEVTLENRDFLPIPEEPGRLQLPQVSGLLPRTGLCIHHADYRTNSPTYGQSRKEPKRSHILNQRCNPHCPDDENGATEVDLVFEKYSEKGFGTTG